LKCFTRKTRPSGTFINHTVFALAFHQSVASNRGDFGPVRLRLAAGFAFQGLEMSYGVGFSPPNTPFCIIQ
jgi:hypothetical protein